jgi:hypothetical protein
LDTEETRTDDEQDNKDKNAGNIFLDELFLANRMSVI